MAPAAPSAACRRRGAELEHAIFDAVLELMSTTGFAGLTMEGVANAARTGKAALYRRWQSKEDLVVEALNHFLPTFEAAPDTGSMRDDLATLLRRLIAMANSRVGGAILALMNELDRDHEFIATLHEKVFAERKSCMTAILDQAVARGEIKDASVASLIEETGPALIVHRVITDGPPIEPEFADTVVDTVLMPLLWASQHKRVTTAKA